MNKPPIGKRISSPISTLLLPEDQVQQDGHCDNDCSENHRALIPRQMFFAWPVCKRINQSDEVFFLTGLGQKANENGHDKTGGPCPDRGPEILRHLAGILMHYRVQPSALNPC